MNASETIRNVSASAGFTPEASAAWERLAHLPFNFGSTICIGAAFAMTEATLVLARLARRLRLRRDP